MPQIQLKLEVSPHPKVTEWWLDVNNGQQRLGLADFLPKNSEGFFVRDKPINIGSPTFPIVLHIKGRGAEPPFTPIAVCYVTINTIAQEHYLRCLVLKGQFEAIDQFLYGAPAGGPPTATLFALPLKK